MTMARGLCLALIGALSLILGGVSGAFAAGPFSVTQGFYDFRARNEPRVATDRLVDLWAQVYRPSNLTTRPFPLLVFLHGNHGTCGRFDPSRGVRVDDRTDYTSSGTCPSGYEVTPNHLGYEYLGRELASWGYIVVSINANRGITAGFGVSGDSGLNLMRGRLILRHLQLLSEWNRGVGSIPRPSSLGFNPKNSMDFSQVGIMGHSRGGEGARAALQQYRDAGSPFQSLIEPMSIRSIFEIGPVDGQTGRVLDANGVNSIILLPNCDGDVSDLQGMHVLDRVFTRTGPTDNVAAFHGTIAVWGANHNAYNTEWLTTDSPGCAGTPRLFPNNGRSPEQQATALQTLVPFFRGTVGASADAGLAARFDPVVKLPAVMTNVTKFDRGYLSGPINSDTRVLEQFTQSTGTGDSGLPTKAVNVSVTHRQASFEHDDATRVATVNWSTNSPTPRSFLVNFSNTGLDLSQFKTFSVRTALRCFGNICSQPADPDGEMDFSIALIDADGVQSKAVRASKRSRISRPVGPDIGSLHVALYTVEIPFADFGAFDFSRVKGMRFRFSFEPAGSLDLGAITVSKNPPAARRPVEVDVAVASEDTFEMAQANEVVAAPTAAEDGNAIRIVRKPGAPTNAPGGGGSVDIVLTSDRSFPVTGAFPKLTVGDETVRGGDVGPDGRTMTISVPAAKFDNLPKGGDVSLFVQASSPVWRFGKLPD